MKNYRFNIKGDFDFEFDEQGEFIAWEDIPKQEQKANILIQLNSDKIKGNSTIIINEDVIDAILETGEVPFVLFLDLKKELEKMILGDEK